MKLSLYLKHNYMKTYGGWRYVSQPRLYKQEPRHRSGGWSLWTYHDGIVRYQVRSCGICGRESGIGMRFLRMLPFPLPILILTAAPHSSMTSSDVTVLILTSLNKRENKSMWRWVGDRLCGLVVRVPGYISRGSGFHSRRNQIFWEVVNPERPWGSVALTT
jgi:hypothetical protein